MEHDMKHTPGPWEVFDESYIREGNPSKGTGRLSIASSTGYQEARIANARLIAAAPELLAVLKELLHCNFSGIEEPWVINARAVVVKAERGAI
jgi:hypothetical protein